MLVSRIAEAASEGSFDSVLQSLYPNSDVRSKRRRLAHLAQNFMELYGDLEAEVFSVPGRTELLGNHTDHNNGCVLAAGVDIDIIAVAAPTGEPVVRMKSEGYREDVVCLEQLTPSQVRKGSSGSIIAGIADYFEKNGLNIGGFAAYTTSDVLTGSGLSSSAAFEVMCAQIFSWFFNGGSVSKMTLAKAGKYAENVFFGKPCGLMDQAACAHGGCLYIDFSNPENIVTKKLCLDLNHFGYRLCIVNTGGNHADLTEDYASVPSEMHSVAALMGKHTLSECDESDFVSRISYLRTLVGDRAILRAMHFFAENSRVKKQKEALEQGDFDSFLSLVEASGDSSFKYLQNVYTNQNPSQQGISLALCITRRFGAVCRVHGGGFAGTIQAYVKNENLNDYVKTIESVFGDGSCHVLTVRAHGACVVRESEIVD